MVQSFRLNPSVYRNVRLPQNSRLSALRQIPAQSRISIGHKDTDNEFTNNTIARNGVSGVYFREETPLNSGYHNTFRSNKVLDNGNAKAGYGFYIAVRVDDTVIASNQISDTRGPNSTQRYAVYKAKGAGSVRLENNKIAGSLAGN